MTERLNVSPQEFVRVLLKPFPPDARAWITTFRHAASPNWNGACVSPKTLPDTDERNAYYSTAAFPKGTTARRIDRMLGAGVIVVDDPTTKGDHAELFERIGPPSFRIETSRGNEQWGFLLDEPADEESVSPVLSKIKELGLGDASGNNAVRYARLPCGVNDKRGKRFRVRCVEWRPARRYRIKDVAEALGVGRSLRTVGIATKGASDRELEKAIKTGESFHGPLTQLAYRWIMRGDRADDVVWQLQTLMRRSEERDTARWRERYEKIERDVLEVIEKFPEAAVKQKLRREGKGFVPDEENVWRILEEDADLAGVVRYDAFMCQRVVTRPIPGDERVVADREYPRRWRDDDTVSIQRYVQRKYIVRIAREKIEAVLTEWAVKRWSFHPIKDYLNRVRWDGKPRIDGWLQLHMGAHGAPHAYVRAISAKWLIAGVARVMEPGCKVDTMLCLEGAQGMKKSMALRVLAGDEFFSDSMPADLSSKDARDHIRGKWICEMSELAQFRKSEIESVKAFLARQVEQFRPAFGRAEIVYPRQCVFAGSTNASEYLIDDTGNRRFWVITCKDIDIELLKRDRDQLWAEAHDRYVLGEKWWLDGEIERIAGEQADARRLHDPWHDEIDSLLQQGTLKEEDQVRPSQVLDCMDLTANQRTRIYAARVGKVLTALGWRKKSRSSREYGRPKPKK